MNVADYPLNPPLASGRTAEIYAWKESCVLKLFWAATSVEEVAHEARVARLVHGAGLPAPAVIGEVIELDGRYGIIYARVMGVSMLAALISQPWNARGYARRLAELQAAIHCRGAVPGLPAQRAKLEKKVQAAELLSAETRTAVLELLAELPSGNQLCHGDFHPDNVLLSAQGPVIIDWMDAANGNPLADVARSSILIGQAHLPADTRVHWVLLRLRELIQRSYVARYFQLRPADRQTFTQWRIVVAAARLSEGVAEAPALAAYVSEHCRACFRP